MAREYFCAYHSLIESLTPYGDAECGRLFRAALVYSATGEEEEFRGNERYIWPTIRLMIDRDKEAYAAKCQTNRINGAKANGTERPRTVPNAPQEKEKDKEEDKGKEKENTPPANAGGSEQSARARFTPPTVEEVSAYCRERGNDVDPEQFVDHYTANGWRVGGKSAMKDWKAAVRNWERNNFRPSASGKKPDRWQPPTEQEKAAGAARDERTMDQVRRLREKIRGGAVT